MSVGSHQAALISILAEQTSLYGLRVKVIPKEAEEFPGGFHYHRSRGSFMREVFEGKKHPILFHMSWTKNKENKLNFLRQLGGTSNDESST